MPGVHRLRNGQRGYSESDVAWLERAMPLRETGMPSRHIQLCADSFGLTAGGFIL